MKDIRNIKNKRYQPLYKKFITLRKNIQYKRKFLKFKKKKWKNFIFYIKKIEKYRSKNFKFFDHNKYNTPRFANSFKKNINIIYKHVKDYVIFTVFYQSII